MDQFYDPFGMEASARDSSLTPDPYGQSIDRVQTTLETAPTAVPGQPPWWKQILGYAAESFRPTSGMGIGDRLHGVAGAKQEAAGRAGRLEEEMDLAKLRGDQARLQFDKDKLMREGEQKTLTEERLTRGTGTWIKVDEDENDTRKFSIFTTTSDGTRLGKQRTPAETKYTVSAKFAAERGFIDPDTGRPPTEPVEIGEGLYKDWTGPPSKPPAPLAPVRMGRSMVPPIQGEGGAVTGYGPPLPGFDVPPKEPTPISTELSPASDASNRRLIDNAYNVDIQGARDEYIVNTLGSELKPATSSWYWDSENQQAGIDTAKRLWRERIEAANKRYVEGYRDVLGEIAPTREDPDLPSVYPESGLEAPPEDPDPENLLSLE